MPPYATMTEYGACILWIYDGVFLVGRPVTYWGA